METQPLVTIIPWTFIAQILNLFIQMYLIKRFLFKPVNEILAKRQALTDKEISDAREAKADADKIREEYEGQMAGAKAEANKIISDAKKDAQEHFHRLGTGSDRRNCGMVAVVSDDQCVNGRIEILKDVPRDDRQRKQNDAAHDRSAGHVYFFHR